MSTTIAAATTCQTVPPRGKVVVTTATAIAIWRRACAAHVEAVGDVWLTGEQPAHHGLPLAAMGAGARPILKMMDQPVGHLMRDYLGQEGMAVLGI